MAVGPKSPAAKFYQTLKLGAVFVLVSLMGFGLARYLEEGKRFDSGSWIVILVLAVAVILTASVRALLAAMKAGRPGKT
jgi:predicted ABC-type exoprotein transport system permease subunit